MQDISLHILDIVQNALRAGASTIAVQLWMDRTSDCMLLRIEDDGTGMSQETVKQCSDPFFTERPDSRTGLGLALLEAGAELTGGALFVRSAVGTGTCVTAVYGLSHPDRPPVGDFAGTLALLIRCNPELDFIVSVCLLHGDSVRTLDTRRMRQLMPGLRLSATDVAAWILERLRFMVPETYAAF